jgi:hypothetical protein
VKEKWFGPPYRFPWAGNTNPSVAATIPLPSPAATGLSPRGALGHMGFGLGGAWWPWCAPAATFGQLPLMVMVLVLSRAVPSLFFLTLVSKPKVCLHRPPAMVHRRRRDLALVALSCLRKSDAHICSIVLHAPSDRIVSDKINICSALLFSMSKSAWTIKCTKL